MDLVPAVSGDLPEFRTQDRCAGQAAQGRALPVAQACAVCQKFSQDVTAVDQSRIETAAILLPGRAGRLKKAVRQRVTGRLALGEGVAQDAQRRQWQEILPSRVGGRGRLRKLGQAKALRRGLRGFVVDPAKVRSKA
jgi:hypothetical protein